MKSRLRHFGTLPISLRHARTTHPNLSDLVGRTSGHRLGFGDNNLLVRQRLATTHEVPGHGASAGHLPGLALRESDRVETADIGGLATNPPETISVASASPKQG